MHQTSKRRERECPNNVPDKYDLYERLLCQKREGWKLYISDCYWVLDIDGYYEFYFNPQFFLGKISAADMPSAALEKIKRSCIMLDDKWQKHDTNGAIVPSVDPGQRKPLSSWVDFKHLENSLCIGNWFYAQGNNYVTTNGKYYEICFPYESCGREYNLCDMNIYDMLRMTASTLSHHYIKSIWDLDCFCGIDTSGIISMPLEGSDWDASSWAKEFAYVSDPAKYHFDRDAIRSMRSDVFRHTVYLARSGKYISERGCEIHFENQEQMIQNSKLYSRQISAPTQTPCETTKIFVENKDCLLSAKEWKDKGYNPAVLNMASRQNPGGGALGGAGAQEENLFRRTNLFMSMYQFAPYAHEYGLKRNIKQYPLDRNFGGVYTPNALVFRGLEEDGYPLLDEPYEMSFISVPAMNRPDLDENGKIAANLIEGVKNKMRTIMNIGLENNHDCLILGAMGCGAFRNPPEHIAQLFHEVINDEFKNAFKVIVFAIIEDHNSMHEHNKKGNFQPFYDEFQSNEQ